MFLTIKFLMIKRHNLHLVHAHKLELKNIQENYIDNYQ